MAFDAIKFLSDYHIRYWTHGKNCQPGWVNITCPFCGDTSNHLGINLTAGNCFCWKCGGKSLWRIIHTLLPSVNPTDILEEYDDVPRYLTKRKNAKAIELDLPGDPLTSIAKQYLRKRRFDPDYLESTYNLRYGGITGDWRYRIIIPIYDRRGKLLTYQGRDITGKLEERYKTLAIEKSVVNPKDVFFNIQNATKDVVGVVEGAFDVMRMGDNFICGLGTTLTQNQLLSLTEFSKVVFVFDPEPEAQAKALKYAQALASIDIEAEVLDIGLDHDPGDCTEDEVKEIRNLVFG